MSAENNNYEDNENSQNQRKQSRLVLIAAAMITGITSNIDRIYIVVKEATETGNTSKENKWYGYYKDVCSSDGSPYLATETIELNFSTGKNGQPKVDGKSEGDVCDQTINRKRKHKYWEEYGYSLSGVHAFSYIESKNPPVGIGTYYLAAIGGGKEYRGIIIIKESSNDGKYKHLLCPYILLDHEDDKIGSDEYLQPCKPIL